jgi:hypothetical protein
MKPCQIWQGFLFKKIGSDGQYLQLTSLASLPPAPVCYYPETEIIQSTRMAFFFSSDPMPDPSNIKFIGDWSIQKFVTTLSTDWPINLLVPVPHSRA